MGRTRTDHLHSAEQNSKGIAGSAVQHRPPRPVPIHARPAGAVEGERDSARRRSKSKNPLPTTRRVLQPPTGRSQRPLSRMVRGTSLFMSPPSRAPAGGWRWVDARTMSSEKRTRISTALCKAAPRLSWYQPSISLRWPSGVLCEVTARSFGSSHIVSLHAVTLPAGFYAETLMT
jgi:hypothetical protein